LKSAHETESKGKNLFNDEVSMKMSYVSFYSNNINFLHLFRLHIQTGYCHTQRRYCV